MGHADCKPRDFSLQSQSQSESAVHSRGLALAGADSAGVYLFCRMQI